MTKRMIAAMLAVSMLATPALALEHPAPGRYDSRVRFVSYKPGQIVSLIGAVGSVMTIQFGDDETVMDASMSDSADLQHKKAGNLLWFKPSAAMPAQPISVRTVKGDGTQRLYVFQWEALTDAPGAYYLVHFTYPADAAKAAAERQRKAEEAAEAARAAELLKTAAPGAINRHYVGQGDRALEPVIWDDGNSTFLRFPGNMRIPSIFVVNPDGKEAVAPYSVEGEIVTLHQTSAGIRLRDGDLVLCIWNRAWNPYGHPTTTGTTSDLVQRTIKSEAGQ